MSFAVDRKVSIRLGVCNLGIFHHISIHTENNTNQQHLVVLLFFNIDTTVQDPELQCFIKVK